MPVIEFHIRYALFNQPISMFTVNNRTSYLMFQDLTVTLMSERSTREVELVEDPNEMHKVNKQSFIDEQEWHLYKCTETDIKVTKVYIICQIGRCG